MEKSSPNISAVPPPTSRSLTYSTLQGSTNRRAPGCVNAAGKLRQKWKARARTKFTKPGARLIVAPCTLPPSRNRIVSPRLWCFRKWTDGGRSRCRHSRIITSYCGSDHLFAFSSLLRYDEEQNAEEHDWQRRSGDDGKEGETEWGFGDGFLKRADKKRQ